MERIARWGFWLASAIILAVALDVRFLHLSTAVLNPDSVTDLEVIGGGAAQIPQRILQHLNPSCPLGFYATYASAKIFGWNPFGVCFPSALTSALTTLALIALGAACGSRVAGLVAGALWAVSPESVYWAHQSRWWFGQPLLSVLIALTFLHFRHRQTLPRLALHWITCLIALYTQAYCAIVIAVLWFSALGGALGRRRVRFFRDRELLLLTGAHALAALLFLPWVIFLMQGSKAYYPGWTAGTDYLLRVLRTLLSTHSPGLVNLNILFIAVGLIAAFFWSVHLGFLLLVLTTTIPWALFIVAERAPFSFASRHLLFTLPFFLLAFGFGVAAAVQIPRLITLRWRLPRTVASAQAVTFATLALLLFQVQVRPHISLIRRTFGEPGWVQPALEKIIARAGRDRAVVLVDHINVGNGLLRALAVFGDPLPQTQMFPAWKFATLQGTEAYRQHPWRTALWVIQGNPRRHTNRLVPVAQLTPGANGTAIYEARPPLRDFDDFADVLAKVYRSLFEGSGAVGAKPEWLEALLLWQRGQEQRAREMALGAARLYPRDPTAVFTAAQMHVQTDPALALECARQAAELVPGERLYSGLVTRLESARTQRRYRTELMEAIAAQASGEWERSLEASRQAAEIDPESGAAQGLIATAAGHLGREDEAREAWIKGVCLISDADSEALWTEARRWLSSRDVTMAQALREGGAGAWQCHRVAQWLYGQGANEEALAAWDQALAVGPPNVEYELGRHRCLMRLGRSADALAAAEEALRINPRHGWAQLYIGDALAALGRNDEAREHWRACLESPIDGGSHAYAQRRLGQRGS